MISEGQMCCIKKLRNCELCLLKRAVSYCVADDAFLCHACDVSVHSANRVARKHERVCLERTGVSDGGVTEAMRARPIWHSGFKTKARTPRVRGKTKAVSVKSESRTGERREDPCVPQIGNERGFLVTEKNVVDYLNPLVPDFHGSADSGIFPTHHHDDDDDDCFMLHTQNSDDIDEIVTILQDEEEAEEKTSCVHVHEMMRADFSSFQDGTGVLDIESDARKRNMFLRLNYEDVMAAWDKHDVLGKPEPETRKFQLVPSEIGFPKRSCFSEREARVWRYRDKRKTRLFEKKIRYQVRKLNAEKRPRIKGRFVRTALVSGS